MPLDYTFITSSDQLEIDADLNVGHKLINVSNGTIASDAINKGQLDSAISALSFLSPSNFVFNEVLTGTGTTRTLANLPIADTQQVFKNGLILTPGVGKDYTISGAVITFASAPKAADKLLAHYLK